MKQPSVLPPIFCCAVRVCVREIQGERETKKEDRTHRHSALFISEHVSVTNLSGTPPFYSCNHRDDEEPVPRPRLPHGAAATARAAAMVIHYAYGGAKR